MSFINPYLGARAASTANRINADISAEDFNFVRNLRIGEGTIQTTISILWKKLVYELKQRGIVSCAQQDEFERIVVGCTIGGIVQQTNVEHDRGGVKSIRAGTTQHASRNEVVEDKGKRTTGRNKKAKSR